MGIGYNFKAKNLFPNGFAQLGDNTDFTAYASTTEDSLSGNRSFHMNANRRGNSLFNNSFIPVDTSKYYRFGLSVKTSQKSYNNRRGSGHLGFACYDNKFRFIDLRNCGGSGNTFLSRDLNPGDQYLYIQSSSGWETGVTPPSNIIFRGIILYPPTHPEYSAPHRYSRIGLGDYNLGYNSMIQMPEGDWRLTISNLSNVSVAMPNIGYPTPAGTPISRGIAGGTYNYALGAPDYPETWTTYVTSVFTGENKNSGLPFRFGTKYIRFLNLSNYNWRNESGGPSAKYYLDNIILTEVNPNSPVPNSFFARKEPW